MASQGSMDDEAFSERVKKTFGSLFATLSPSPSPSSLSNPLWSLTDSQVPKKEWRRDTDSSRDSNPCSSSFDDFLSHARKNSRQNLRNYRKELQEDGLQDLDVGGEEDEGEDVAEKVDLNDWDVKSSIGLDSTLDHEEEEDTFDKVALGRENAGDRLYMRDIKGGDSHNVSLDDLPGAVGSKGRDPRANRHAARIRLKEDDAEAAALAEDHKPEQFPSTADKDSAMSAESLDKLKPILKRKQHESTSKSSKRVRFDPECISCGEGAREAPSNKTSAENITQVCGSASNENVSRVPDYVQNPFKYTRYSLDSVDESDDKSNTGAYLDFIEIVKKAKNAGSGSDSDVPTDLPKSVTFVPKKKSDTSKGVHIEASLEKGSDAKRPPLPSTFLDVAAEELETEVGDMEVDEPEINAELDKGIMFRKQSRQYRKPQADEPA